MVWKRDGGTVFKCKEGEKKEIFNIGRGTQEGGRWGKKKEKWGAESRTTYSVVKNGVVGRKNTLPKIRCVSKVDRGGGSAEGRSRKG